jgi:2-phospho-L-lactate guanylyltransferase
MDATSTGPGRDRAVFAVIPIGALDGAKSRLGAVLDAEERRDLAERLARRTIQAAVAAPGIVETIVVTPDDAVRELALTLGARPLREQTGGLNAAIRHARAEVIAGGGQAMLILPTDLPDISSDAIGDLLATLDSPDRPIVAIVPDRHDRGTNALLMAPPDAIDVCFGGDSRSAHAAAAEAVGARLVRLDGPLTLDLDTPEDLLLAERRDPELALG